MLYGFVRIFYYVIWELKEDNLIWRNSWGLLSVINLLGGLYFLGYEEYLKKIKVCTYRNLLYLHGVGNSNIYIWRIQEKLNDKR